MKPIIVWLTPSGPNPWKVVVVLEELGLPYELKSFSFEDVKKKPFIDINPNGRVPAIVDPNTDLTLWESGAIIQYLIEQYDTEKILSYDSLREKHLLNQWLHFQMSGQGPYYGQLAWFTVLHAEKLPSAITRYKNEALRVLGVLNTVLEGKAWLVGDKCTFVDLSFLPWNENLGILLGATLDEVFEPFPNVQSWHDKMRSRESWVKCCELRTRLMGEQGLDWTGMPKGINSMDEYQKYIAERTVTD
ncbi:glutathione transferase [Aspergillus insuetus]